MRERAPPQCVDWSTIWAEGASLVDIGEAAFSLSDRINRAIECFRAARSMTKKGSALLGGHMLFVEDPTSDGFVVSVVRQ